MTDLEIAKKLILDRVEQLEIKQAIDPDMLHKSAEALVKLNPELIQFIRDGGTLEEAQWDEAKNRRMQ